MFCRCLRCDSCRQQLDQSQSLVNTLRTLSPDQEETITLGLAAIIRVIVWITLIIFLAKPLLIGAILLSMKINGG